MFNHIQFEFLTTDRISQFIDWIYERFELMNPSLWNTVGPRLKLDVSPKYQNARQVNHCAKIHLKPESPLDGVIARLTLQGGGNVHDKGVVSVSAKSTDCSFFAKNAADLTTSTYFQAPNEPDQWICYDFKDHRVRPTDYSICAHPNGWFLRSWVIEGSVDGLHFDKIIDRRDNNTEANSEHPIGTFSVSCGDYYRAIRLRQTGKNQNGDYRVILNAFEIFGDLA
jgi:hypothetical protein